MKISLCPEPDCKNCPSVEIFDDHVTIGEYDNICTLNKDEWNILKNKIKNNKI